MPQSNAHSWCWALFTSVHWIVCDLRCFRHACKRHQCLWSSQSKPGIAAAYTKAGNFWTSPLGFCDNYNWSIARGGPCRKYAMFGAKVCLLSYIASCAVLASACSFSKCWMRPHGQCTRTWLRTWRLHLVSAGWDSRWVLNCVCCLFSGSLGNIHLGQCVS